MKKISSNSKWGILMRTIGLGLGCITILSVFTLNWIGAVPFVIWFIVCVLTIEIEEDERDHIYDGAT